MYDLASLVRYLVRARVVELDIDLPPSLDPTSEVWAKSSVQSPRPLPKGSSSGASKLVLTYQLLLF